MANTINILKPSGCFEVQKIIGISTIHGNCRSYLVQWASSWISGAHLIGCEDLIEQFEHEQTEKEYNIKVEEIDTNHSQDSCRLTDRTNNDKVVTQHNLHDDSAPKQQIKKVLQANVSKDTNSSPSPSHINRQQSNSGLKVSSLNSIIQQISGNDDKLYVDRNSVHPDFQRMKTDVWNVKDVDVDSKGHLSSNSGEAMVIVKEDTNCGQTKDVRLQNVQYFNGGNRKMAMPSNPFGKSTIKTCTKKRNVNISINVLSNVGESSRSCENKQGKKPLERRNKARKTLQCNICNKVFSNDHALKNHSKLHKGIHRCATCFKTFACKQKLQEHELIHSGCNSLDFKNQSRIHKVIHQCSICFKIFACKENLQKHELIHITCSICKEKFTDMDKLQAHVPTHKTVKADPLECSYCVKIFQCKAYLERHTRVHTGERPFECKVCQRKFKVKSHLQVHEKKHV